MNTSHKNTPEQNAALNAVNKTQVGGKHYASGYQHWDFVRLCLAGRYLEGCVTKYVARHHKKNGLQDLNKAMHYLDKIIALFDAELYESAGDGWKYMHGNTLMPNATEIDFCLQNGLGPNESSIIIGMVSWRSMDDLRSVRETLSAMILDAEADERHGQAIKAGAHVVDGMLVGVSVDRATAADLAAPGRGYVDQDAGGQAASPDELQAQDGGTPAQAGPEG